MAWEPSPEDTPFQRIGGEARVRAIVERFYDVMGEREHALAKLHTCDPDGRVGREARERFGLFLVGWLGGPQDYAARFGHPRLRMRHANVAVTDAMRDAWLRCMKDALDANAVDGELRAFLDARFEQLAFHLRNSDG